MARGWVDDGDMRVRLRTLGETLRAIRVERGFSLGEVAEGTDLSTSFLSLVENGRSDISTGRLFRIARFLGVGLGELLDTVPLAEVTVVRAADRRGAPAPADGVAFHPVVGDAHDVTMAPVICEYEAGAIVSGGTRSEAAQHFIFVVRGEVELTRKDDEPLTLEEGDCAYFRSEHECTLRNAADGRSTLVWVSSPPASGGPAR
jgi:transcriptional regulator with XRE-family HTH domain/mannose-6-phosphate isomerase-like protein (cupin superfamily)